MTALIPIMQHKCGGLVKSLFNHDAWRYSEDRLWDPIAETATSPDDEEFVALFGSDAECDHVPFELLEQFHK